MAFFHTLVNVLGEGHAVDAGDLLVNDQAAAGVVGGGSNYTFTFPQPPYGPVTIAWSPCWWQVSHMRR